MQVPDPALEKSRPVAPCVTTEMVPMVVPALMAKFVVADPVDSNSTAPALTPAPVVTTPAGAVSTVIVSGLVTLLEKPALPTVAVTAETLPATFAAIPTVIVIVSLRLGLHAVINVQVNVEGVQLHMPSASVMATGVRPAGSVTVRKTCGVVGIAEDPVFCTVTITVSPTWPPVNVDGLVVMPTDTVGATTGTAKFIRSNRLYSSMCSCGVKAAVFANPPVHSAGKVTVLFVEVLST